MRLSYSVIGMIAICIAAASWGVDGVILTPRLYNLHISFVVFTLHALPFLLMQLFFFKEYKQLSQFKWQDWLSLSFVALLGGAIGTLAIVKALFLVNFQALTIVLLLQKLQPVFAVLLALVILKERVGKYYFLWATTAIMMGYFLTFGLHKPNWNTGSNTIYAALYALLAAFSFGSSTVFSKKFLAHFSFKTATFFRYGLTTLFMAIIVTVTHDWAQLGQVTQLNWLIFIIIMFTSGSAAIYLYYFGLMRVKASISIICELCFPLTAIILDYAVNGTRLSSIQWVAAIIMLYAIYRLSADKEGA